MMNFKTITVALLAIVFWAGPPHLAAQPSNEWAGITYVQGRWSRLYFDYVQPNTNYPGTFYVLNDWVVNQGDGCVNGGIVCDSSNETRDSCEVNLFYFQSPQGQGGTLYTITIYKNGYATVNPSNGLPGLLGAFSWNPSPNLAIEHTIWEFSFPTWPIVMVEFVGHDPAVPKVVWTPQTSTYTSGPSTGGHLVDGIFADNIGPDVACNPPRSFQSPASLPSDPGIPPLKIELHEGGGVTVTPNCSARGDVDGNGIPLTVSDLVYLINYVEQGGPAPLSPWEADLTGDCIVDSLDIKIFQCYFIAGLSCFDTYPVPTCCNPRLGCCFDFTGNVDCDPSDGVDISDLSILIDHLYITFTPLCCSEAANIDGDPAGGIDISDLSWLIDYLYISFTPPAPCQ
jgi:hypothetical protein